MSVQLSVCIVNYNACKMTLECLDSIVKNTYKITYEIIAVDNASVDDSVAAIKKKHPNVKLIINSRNQGFGIANNQALLVAKGKYIILLNNDTILKNDALDKMAVFMEMHSYVGAMTCKLFDADGKTIQHNCRAFPTPLGTMFGRASLFTKMCPNNPWSSKNLLKNWDYNSIRDVDWISGAAMMVRREVISQVGLLDAQTFFMYWEDTDWCKRIHDAGWKIYFIPDAEIIHLTGQGGGKRSLWLKLTMIYHMHQSAYNYFRKHYYRSPLHPMAILLFIGMVILISSKSIIEAINYVFT